MPYLHAAFRQIGCLLRQRRGNVIMLFSLALPVMLFAIGMGIDYARAMQAQTKLNAIADSAALTAVSKTVMGASDAMAISYATNVFQAQAQGVTGTGNVHITQLVVQAPTDASGRRNATVRYTGVSDNVFARILGVDSLSIGGGSATTNSIAPNIDFYMVLDVSASMALPTTSAGLAKVAQSNSKGCKFACHSVNDEKGRDANGRMTDLYGVAKSYGLKLRIDEEGAAVQRLTTNIAAASSKTGAQYRVALVTFRGRGGLTRLVDRTTDMTLVRNKAGQLKPPLYYSNSCPTQACARSEVGWGDRDSAMSDATGWMRDNMDAPGTGATGQTPQGVMFLVTDGMRDELRNNGQPEVAIDTSICDAIKARNIRIAVLYTAYLPEAMDNDGWSQTNVVPYLYKVEPALQRCASPGLYTKVTTDDDISAAMGALFQTVVATARITR
ncbi:TadE/TadG family type IV pilus assembly protein [Sphingomonadaceae bacterium jetA1]|jgi:Flp pilus assembly protein TadG|uniref:TadE/TadG family type IV pilus assembly protein n=1 Tax=Facivitalis istanbulensis TaxID=3075838 RepID=UPI003493C75F